MRHSDWPFWWRLSKPQRRASVRSQTAASAGSPGTAGTRCASSGCPHLFPPVLSENAMQKCNGSDKGNWTKEKRISTSVRDLNRKPKHNQSISFLLLHAQTWSPDTLKKPAVISVSFFRTDTDKCTYWWQTRTDDRHWQHTDDKQTLTTDTDDRHWQQTLMTDRH